MRRTQLPISALPAFCKLNDVSCIDTGVQDVAEKGFGLVTERTLNAQDTFDITTLLLVPHDLILSAEFLEEHAKFDHHFRQLLDAAGGKSFRSDALLFLLMQITVASIDHGQTVGLSNPWTGYVKMLPNEVPVPTMWTEEERSMLIGTSLEPAVSAKMAALAREFETLQESTATIPWCQKCWWEEDYLQLTHLLLVDAWFRSRSLELPVPGEAMVPVLDMVNHSDKPNAYYEQAANGTVTLLLRPELKLDVDSEITISYGDSKSASEMLFSYGFIDKQSTTVEMVLTLLPFSEDPLGKAKLAAFQGPPIIRISEEEGAIKWDSPFLYMLCLNEEDGLEFKVLRQTDGSRSPLRVFWQGSDVTEKSNMFETLISQHELQDVFRLRAVALLQDRLQNQLERLYGSGEELESLLASPRQSVALQLRDVETTILEAAFASVDDQKKQLLKKDIVLRYLGSMDDARARPEGEQSNTDEEDFS